VRLATCFLLLASGCWAQGTSVVHTVHNLSAFGPGEVKVLGEKEVCKFCHVPHSATVSAPLWGRPVPQGQFRVPEVSAGRGKVPAPQPDGASRLCLSCHDGSVAQGFSPAAKTLKAFSAGGLREKGDLSGSHPVSIPLPESSLDPDDERDMGVKARAVIAADPTVRLDKDGKLQCTTCHDPHADPYYQPGVVPHFWVRPTVDEVCLACHELR
jgi:hypothetical protein